MKKYINVLKGVKIPWMLLLVLFAAAIATGQLEVKTVLLTANIIDSARNTISLNQLLSYIAFLAGTVIVGVINAWVGGIAYGRIDMGVRKKVFAHIVKLPISYYDSEDGKELASRITSDAGSSSAYFEVLMTTFGAVYAAYLAFKTILGYSETLGRYTLLIIPVAIVVGGLYGFFTYYTSKLSVNSSAVTTGYLFHRVGAFKVVKAFNTRDKEIGTSKKMFQKMFKADLLQEMTLAFAMVGIQILSCMSIVIAFVFGSRLVNQGVLTIGELIAFYSLSGTVGIQLVNLFLSYGGLTSVNGCLSQISRLLLIEPESLEGEEMETTEGDIRFKNVSFGYTDATVLDAVDFTIEKNKVTAVIGTNGAGKSTVFKLMQRMYEPGSGEILFNDKNIKDYSLKSWRDNISVVSQDAPLFSGTIRENMCYGTDETVSDERLTEIAKACGIYEYITSQEGGFDSTIAIGSANVSGGQKQCLAIARAFLKDSEFLLLDEATKSLDAASEKTVKKALATLMKGRTTVMIAHNPSAVALADNIVVMEKGRVVDFGTPDELIKRNKYYQSFMQLEQE